MALEYCGKDEQRRTSRFGKWIQVSLVPFLVFVNIRVTQIESRAETWRVKEEFTLPKLAEIRSTL